MSMRDERGDILGKYKHFLSGLSYRSFKWAEKVFFVWKIVFLGKYNIIKFYSIILYILPMICLAGYPRLVHFRLISMTMLHMN